MPCSHFPCAALPVWAHGLQCCPIDRCYAAVGGRQKRDGAVRLGCYPTAGAVPEEYRMRRASSPTLPRRAPARPALLPRPLYRWLRRLLPELETALAAGVRATAADAGRRRCTSRAHACFLLAHALSD